MYFRAVGFPALFSGAGVAVAMVGAVARSCAGGNVRSVHRVAGVQRPERPIASPQRTLQLSEKELFLNDT